MPAWSHIRGRLAALALEHGVGVCSADTDLARVTGLRWTNPLAAEADPARSGVGSRPVDLPVDLPVDVDAIRDVLRRHGVVFALVFGSRVAGRARPGSDIDLAVWAREALDDWRLRGELPDAVDLLDLRRAPDALTGRVAMTGVVLLDDDPPARVRWQAETRKRHLDESFRRERFRADFVRAHG